MSVWARLGDAIFTGDRAWAWRRRTAFAGCAVFLAGVVNSIWFDPDLPHATMVMSNCVTGFGATFAAYAGLAVADDHFKRETERKAQQP
jgi:hypothetical protein